jgi:membrane protease YdiL (CAAX protease family)
MEMSGLITPVNVVAAVLTLAPMLIAAFFARRVAGCARRLPGWGQVGCPALLCVPYLLVTRAAGDFRCGWLTVYLLTPVAVAGMLWWAGWVDPEKKGNWRDFVVLGVLGLAVDLRWFEGAWPAHLAVFSKMLLLDAGIYGFLAVRDLDGVGFDLRLRGRDAWVGLREAGWYTPIALAMGLGLGFLHVHRAWPGGMAILEAWVFTFFLIAVPEELFFRGWVQNLLERRMGRVAALVVTAVLFGLAHFNKRTVFFNWKYVLLAAVAGIFYGRAWRAERRVGASAVTHATVDAIWGLWLR